MSTDIPASSNDNQPEGHRTMILSLPASEQDMSNPIPGSVDEYRQNCLSLMSRYNPDTWHHSESERFAARLNLLASFISEGAITHNNRFQFHRAITNLEEVISHSANRFIDLEIERRFEKNPNLCMNDINKQIRKEGASFSPLEGLLRDYRRALGINITFPFDSK